MISRLIVSAALFVAQSKRYEVCKHFFKDLLENTHKPYKRYFDFFMIFVVISSIVLLIQEVKNPLPQWLVVYNYEVVTTIFVIEYFLRLWIYSDIHALIIHESDKAKFMNHPLSLRRLMRKILNDKFAYIRSPQAIIDLLAIIPSYRPLRVLRIFLLFRAFKLLRYTSSVASFFSVLYAKKFELFTLLVFLSFIVFISGVLIYVFEGDGTNPDIAHFFDALYWSLVSITTVGYGDISPVTVEGKVVSMVIIVSGIGIISFATSIIVSAFSERLHELKAERSFRDAEKLKKFYLVCGYSSMAEMIVKRLLHHGFDVVVIDRDLVKIDAAHKEGCVAILGDATKLHTYYEMNLAKVERIIGALTLISDEVQNIYITLTIRSISGHIPIYARAQNRHVIKKLKLAGATDVIYPNGSIGSMATEFINHPVAFDALRMMIAGHEETSVNEVLLFEHDKPVGKMLGEIDFFALRLVLVGVKREGVFHFSPQKDFILQANDILMVVGKAYHVTHLNDAVLSVKGKRK